MVIFVYFLNGFKFWNQYWFFSAVRILVKFSAFSFAIRFIVCLLFYLCFAPMLLHCMILKVSGREAAVDIVSTSLYFLVTCAIFCALIIRSRVNVSFWGKLATGTGQSFTTKIAGLFYLLYRV